MAYANKAVNKWAHDTNLMCEVFTYTYEGTPFAARDLVNKIPEIAGYSARYQTDIIRAWCVQFVKQSTPDNRLLRKHGAKFIWDSE